MFSAASLNGWGRLSIRRFAIELSEFSRIDILTRPDSLSRDSPDESATGINVRAFPVVLQDRREVNLTMNFGACLAGGGFTPCRNGALLGSLKTRTLVNTRNCLPCSLQAGMPHQ